MLLLALPWERIRELFPICVGLLVLCVASPTTNILTLKLAQENARQSKVPQAMLLLDFQKAYDRVDHEYMWAVTWAYGFCSKFIELVQGLVTSSIAKVHFNGWFTERFNLGRGVRQGCLLAPLLFALVTLGQNR
jgi:hypothetical protein